MRRRESKDGHFAPQCQVFGRWLIKRHLAEKIGKFLLLPCNTICSIEYATVGVKEPEIHGFPRCCAAAQLSRLPRLEGTANVLSMTEILLSGPLNGTHVVAARLACEEKGLFYSVQEPDLLKAGGFRLAELLTYLCDRQPTLSHAGLMLFDLEAILRYVDEAFPGPILQPEHPRDRALMTQIMAVIRTHLVPSAVGVVIAQRLFMPFLGGVPDLGLVTRIQPAMQDALYVIEQLSLLSHDGEHSEFLIGADLSLADIMLLPIAFYLMATSEGKSALNGSTRLFRWWLATSRRAAWARSKPKLG